MKRFFYKLGTQAALAATILLLAFAPFQTLIAQAAGPVSCPPGQPSDGTCIPSGATSATPSAGGTASVNLPAGSNNPSSDIFGNCGISNISACVSALIYAFTIGIGSFFAYIAAYFFDITIQLSLNGASYGLDFISTSWTTARDLGNMAFLFILLYIAFTLIFKAETGQTKTMLAMVILVALLVNFSFFFSRVVIDAGNIVSIQFYNAIPAKSMAETMQGAQAGASPAASYAASLSQSIGGTGGGTKDLTASIMGMLNIQGLLNNNSFAATNNSFIATVVIYLAGAIVLWLLTIAFITNGIKFLVRVVVLWFLIIASPLALIAIAIEGPGGYFKQWREMLVQHAFYPVAFMFVFLVLNNFAVSMTNNTSLTGGVFTTTATTGASSVGAIGASLVALSIRLALVIAVLYYGMKAADTISVKGSEFAGNAGKWVGAHTFGYAYGAAYRRTGGALANKIDNSVKNSKWANTPGTLGGVLGYRLRKNVLAPVKKTSLGTVASSFDDREKFLKDRKKEMTDNMKERADKDLTKETLSKVKEAAATIASGGTVTPDQKNAVQRLSKKVMEDNMTASEIKAVGSIMTEDQIKKVGEIEKLSETDRDGIKAHWEEKSEDAPFNKSLKKLRELTDARTGSAAARAALATHQRAGLAIDNGFAASLKSILQADHRTTTIDYTSKESDFRDALRVMRPFKAAYDAAVAADAAAPTAATAAAVTAAAAALAPHAATYTAAQTAMNDAHAERQKTQDRLDAHKDFDESRKNVQPNATLNNKGVKGTYKSSLV